MLSRSTLLSLAPPLLRSALAKARDEVQLKRFRAKGRAPWSPGYLVYRERFLRAAFADEALASSLRSDARLPAGYGIGVDERCVELPWVMARLPRGRADLLDAGSALNEALLLEQPALREKTISIFTLGPEPNCFHERGISYVYGDLRRAPMRDALYDVVVCASTLEHVGLDNTAYTGAEKHREDRRDDFERAMAELHRVLKPGGELLLTVPFGTFQRFDGFQQFDRALLDRAIGAFGAASDVDEVFFRYDADGWSRATAEACAQCRYFVPGGAVAADHAAAARAVACVRLVKA